MTTYSRKDWGARTPTAGPGDLTPSRVEGIALHWPAMSSPLRTVAAVMDALRSWQTYHMLTKGWSDIAYQVAVDQAGNRYILRGLAVQSGANGGDDVNERFGAALLVVAPGEQPTPELIAEVRTVVADHRAMFPNSRRVVGHSQIRPEPTACPGPAVLRLINEGAFNPRHAQEDDMQLDEKLWPAQDNSPDVREALRAVIRLEKAEQNRAEQIRAAVQAVREAVDANADKAEIRTMLNNLDATIVLQVGDGS